MATPKRFRRLISGLDNEELAAFVEDLWTARGWTTSRAGATVLATRERPSERQVLYVVPSGCRFDRQFDRPIDVVIAPNPSQRARRVADGHTATLLDDEDLHEIFWYALDPESRRQLLTDHLGAVGLSGPDRRPGRSEDWLSVPGGWRGGVAIGTACLLLVTIGIVVVGMPAWISGDSTTADGSAAMVAGNATAGPTRTVIGTPTATSVTRPQGPERFLGVPPASIDTPPFPPGIGPDGIADTEALATAHRRITDSLSYRLEMAFSGAVDAGDSRTIWLWAQQTATVRSEREYRFRIRGMTRVDGNRTRVNVSIYADNGRQYRRDIDGDTVQFSVTQATRRPADPDLFAVLAERYIKRYLATDGPSSVERTWENGSARYRVVVSNPQSTDPFGRSLTVTAVIEPSGFVRSLLVTYKPGPGSRNVLVFGLRYEAIGSTTVDPPGWLHSARTATRKDATIPVPEAGPGTYSSGSTATG